MFENIIKESLKKAILNLGFDNVEINLEHPAEDKNGDYSSNIALALFSKIDKGKYSNPRELGLEILEELNKNKEINEVCQKIEIAGPGFLNFYFKDKNLIEKIFVGKFVNKKEKNNKKIIIEFTDPNPFKLFHIGHLYSNSVGESLSRIFDFEGWEVRRANYQGDVGMHVAKTIWGTINRLQVLGFSFENLEENNLDERIKFLGEAYAMGSTEYKDNETVKKEIAEINYLVYISAQRMLEKSENWVKQVNYENFLENGQQKYSLDEIKNIYEKGRKWSLEYFENIYKKLGTKFDHYFFESKTGEYGIKIVREFLNKGVFEESNGAVVYKGEKDGLHTRVFVNSLGLPTYEAKDLGLAPLKYETFSYDKSLVITANEIDEYFKVILKVLSKINPDLASKTIHISHGVVKLPEGKMSSRTGNVITGDMLLEEVKKKIVEIMEESQNQFFHRKHGILRHDKLDLNSVSSLSRIKNQEEEKEFSHEETGHSSSETQNLELRGKEGEEIAEKLSIAAIKYAFLKNSIGGDIVFDLDKSLSLSGNSGPYIEYTYARSKSVLRKNAECRMQNIEEENLATLSSVSSLLSDEERSVLRYIYRFEEIVSKALDNYNPSEICNFVFELCQRFNSFYNKHKIINQELRTQNFHLFGGQVELRQEGEEEIRNQKEKEIESFRIRLTEIVSEVVKTSLYLLGIETVEKM